MKHLLLPLALIAAPGAQVPARTPIGADASGLRTMPGIRYQVLKRGEIDGPRPARTSAVKVRYAGTFVDGKPFDSSADKLPDGTAIFPVRGVIPGFQAALLQMRKGDRWRIVIPPELAYGAEGHPLSGRVLVFDLELIDFAALPPIPPPTMTELPGR